MTWTWRGSLACSRASAGRASPTTTSSSRAQRALGLGDDLVGDDEHVAGLVAAVAAAARRGRRPGAPRAGRRSAHAAQAGSSPRSSRASSPRVCAAPPVRASSAARRTARSSAVSTSSTSERGSATRQRAPLAPAACSWRSRLPGPKLGAIASGGVSSSALVPVPWRSGTIDDVGRAHGAGQQLVELARVERRAVAGDEQHALVVALAGPSRRRRAPRASGRGRRRRSTRRRRRGPAPRRRSRR